VPEQLELRLAPVDDEPLYRSACPPETATYGLDFSAVRNYAVNLPQRARVAPRALLAPGLTAYEYDAYRATANDIFATSHIFTASRSGTLHGFCSWFRAQLVEGVALTNAPPADVHWDNIFFPLCEPVAIEAGMTILLDFRAEEGGPLLGWTWRTVVKRGEQTVASFEQCSRGGAPRSVTV
jgi:hypothetical protein